jgi:hypothetical protein
MDKDFMVVTELTNEFEADILRDCLTDLGIDFRIQSLDDPAFGSVFQFFHGRWGNVWAAKEDKEQIEQLLAQIRNDAGVISEETEFADNE